MFALDKHSVSVPKVTVITGNVNDDDKHSGLTLSCETTVSGDVIDAFDKDLRPAFFRKQKKGDQLDLDKPNEGLVMLKFPRAASIAWEEDFPGYRLVLSSDGLFDQEFDFEDVKLRVKSFKFAEGGSVIVSFNLNIYPPDSEEKGMLTDLQRRDAVMTLVPPTAQ